MDIEWLEELPERVAFKLANKPGKYVDFALTLKTRPGVWSKFPRAAAKTEKSAKSVAQSVNRGSLTGFTKGFYEAVADVEDVPSEDDAAVIESVPVIYVRCLPEDDWPEEQDEPGTSGGGDDDPPSTTDVRRWARSQGMEVSERGRVSQQMIQGYLAAQRRGELRSVE